MKINGQRQDPSRRKTERTASRRKLISGDPYLPLYEGKPVRERGRWPSRWIGCRDIDAPPFVTAYRRHFTLQERARFTVHVSADERYDLFLDGRRIGRGSERGDPRNWYYESYEWDLPAGDHVVVARVWTLGDLSPLAQMSVRPGFLFSPEERYLHLLSTGAAGWEAKQLAGYGFAGCWPAFGVGGNLVVDGSLFPWGFERGEGEGWKPVEVFHEGADADLRRNYRPGHLMRPATLPPMMEVRRCVGRIRHVDEPDSENTRSKAVRREECFPEEAEEWQRMCRGGSVVVGPRKRRRVLVDLEEYYCAYPELTTTGGKGSMIRILWAEALYEKPMPEKLSGYWWKHCPKGNRDEVEEKYFYGLGDVFLPDGGGRRRFDTLWWQSGRYLEIYVETASEPLTIDSFEISETRYPLEMESSFSGSDPALSRALPIMLRGLQMCSHEIFMDCPYYEQLMYVGDTRLEALATYVITADHRLPRKALMMFDASRFPDGLTQCRYPTRLVDIMPPFSLWWVAMVHDYALWHHEPDFIRFLMPGVRAVMDAYETRFITADGLVKAASYVNFMDWVPGWESGVPPDAEFGTNGMMNWQYVLVLEMVSKLEGYIGEPERSRRAERLASERAAVMEEAFWDEQRELFAEDLSRRVFTEHTQCLALLSSQLKPDKRAKAARALLKDPHILPTTIYFTHYLFETYRLLGAQDRFFERLGLWLGLEKQGFKTTYEFPEPTRSDCHGWGAHPIYHYFATILGIRPAGMGFESVEIAPQLGHLTQASGYMIHKNGKIQVDFRQKGGIFSGKITLPNGLAGMLKIAGQSIPLEPGHQKFEAAMAGGGHDG